MNNVKVRYAPSPTGIPHIGNIRTALFNFLFAKNQGGEFMLRIEDTDRKRLVPESVVKIKDSLRALGISWDREELQSERLEIYKKDLEKLKRAGNVYESEGAWFFKIPEGKNLEWVDAIHGKISFNSDSQQDFVVIKSDGFPTYHFASVVDDYDMQISHVFRGDEWISSTPKHLLLYEALGYKPPIFVHLPPIMGTSGKKLSKREGAESVFYFLDQGYLPEAIVNFLAFLGWSPKSDRELYSEEDLTREFSLDRINKNSPVFNLEKLNWFNKEWIKNIDQEDLEKRIKQHNPHFATTNIKNIIPLAKERMKTLNSFTDLADFFVNAPKIDSIPPIEINIENLKTSAKELEKLKSWTSAAIKDKIDICSKDLGIDRIALISAIRNVISGKTVTPPLYESKEILGKVETTRRINEYLDKNT